MNKILNSKIILMFLFVFFFFGSVNFSNAATLTQITATPSDVTAGSTVSYTINFTTTTTIANSGKVAIQFPDGFNVSSASFTSWTGFDGTQTLSVLGQTITITRTSGTSSTAGNKSIVLGNIVNSSTTANNYQVTVTTKNSSNTTLDGPTSSIYFQIFSSNTLSTLTGPYYFRDDLPTHYQNQGSPGTGFDTGTLSKTAPTSAEDRHCTAWVQFYFDENGTYTTSNTISNIYYHTWWRTTNNQGVLGYEKTGAYVAFASESFAVTSTSTPDKVGDYYLYAGRQNPSSLNPLGNSIYNLSVILYNNNKNPFITSSPSRPSFVIFNLPDNIDTLGLSQDGDTDYDNDGLTDYAELFTYYTNPYDSDTDNDGWNDGYEVTNSLDPNDPDSAPSFDGSLIRQFNGSATTDLFGYSVSSIGDIDGDNKEDVLVGAYSTDPGGLSGAGSAYIYSSGTGNLIKQYNGTASADTFGYSVSSIGDIDGDNKEDVLVGAPYASPGGLLLAGSAYLYSSATGNLIRQFNGGSMLDFFGTSVSSIGDIDGDNKEDVLIGAPGASPGGLSGAGSAYIYSSATGNLIKQYSGAATSDSFGNSISSISDIDGDTKDDVLVGAYSASPGGVVQAGSSYIYSSGTGNLIRQYNGVSLYDAFGQSVSSISDIDGDSKKDVLVGSYASRPGGSDAGSVYIYSSGTGSLIRQYDGESSPDFFGQSVSSISDLDGDDKEDILIGAYSAGTENHYEAGSAYLYSSGTGNLIKRFNGQNVGDNFGNSVSSIGDIDGDGKKDVLVGAFGADPGSMTNAGSVYLYSSATTTTTESWTKGTSKTNAFDLDSYFADLNNLTLPARNQTISYVASTNDNPYIDVSIAVDNQVSFSQPAEWAGTEAVVFTATDSTNLSSSGTVNLIVSGTKSLNAPTIQDPVVNSPSSITWSWIDNSEIEESYRVSYTDNGNGTANNATDLNPQVTKSSSGSVLSWTDSDLSPNTKYSIQVTAYRTDTGESSPSTTATATTQAVHGGSIGRIFITPPSNFVPTPSSSTSACPITFTLRLGNKGNQVKCLQTKLNILSDGIFGKKTKAAVIKFQLTHELKGDGIVGPKTRKKINMGV